MSDGSVSDGNRDVKTVERRIRDCHGETVAAVARAADAVVEGWDAESATDGRSVARDLERELDRRDLRESLVEALVDGVRAAGHELPAEPVPAPPYLAVTARGPVLRATVEDGRFVVAVRVFRVRRADGARYVRDGSTPAEVLSVAFRPDPRSRG